MVIWAFDHGSHSNPLVIPKDLWPLAKNLAQFPEPRQVRGCFYLILLRYLALTGGGGSEGRMQDEIILHTGGGGSRHLMQEQDLIYIFS